jgi:hypothetical protein
MKNFFLVSFAVVFTSCAMQNDRLLSYESTFMGKDHEIYDLINKNIIPKYSGKKIYINEVIGVNACGEYEGYIEFKGDSIYLIQDNKSFTMCASKAFVRVKYVIDNPENKKYKFKFIYD